MSTFEEKYDLALRKWIIEKHFRRPGMGNLFTHEDIRDVELKSEGGYYYSELTNDENTCQLVFQIRELHTFKKGAKKGQTVERWSESMVEVEGTKMGPWLAEVCQYVVA